MCTDENPFFQNQYLCSAMAAYAHACAKSGSPVNWLSDQKFKQACEDSFYGQCTNGLVYSDCTTNYLKSCKYITHFGETASKYSKICVQGCVCPDNKYLDDSDPENLKCVDAHECSCYDSETQMSYKADYVLQKGCSNW